MDIRQKTLETLNGIKYLQSDMIGGLKEYVCHTYGFPKTEETYAEIDEAIKIYFSVTN